MKSGKHLGVNFDQKLTLDYQILNLCNKANYGLMH